VTLEWANNYNVHVALIKGVGRLTVGFTPDGWRITVFGARMAKMAPDLKTGQKMAIGCARRVLRAGLDALQGEGEQ
jgi:hypothetical protein